MLLHVSHGLVASVVGVPFLVRCRRTTCLVAALLIHLVQSLHRPRRYLLRVGEPKLMREETCLLLQGVHGLGQVRNVMQMLALVSLQGESFLVTVNLVALIL